MPYFDCLFEVVEYLEQKYNEKIDHVNAIAYEKTEYIRGVSFWASVYRLPSGRYEVVDYSRKV
jgi:hypothetical protein